MIDEFNATEHPKALYDPLPPQWEILRDLPWGVPGCTGIIARNSQDGTVYHARNQDLDPVPILLDLNYIGIFEKGGEEVQYIFIAPVSCLLQEQAQQMCFFETFPSLLISVT